MNINNGHHLPNEEGVQLFLWLLFFLALFLYVTAAALSNRRFRKWPLACTVFWCFGIFCMAASITGPLAARAHTDFTAHMLGHLFLGMLAPLFLVLAAPITLLLRTLPVKAARRFARILKSRPVHVASDPFVAAFLNVGGLWLLYTTDLYGMMLENSFLHIAVHVHVFVAGFLFTAAILSLEPVAHRKSHFYRSIALVAALAGHGILAKYIYAHPPEGVSRAEAEAGGMIMYYGGDAIDLVLIILLCFQWFRSARPRSVTNGFQLEKSKQEAALND